jgi:hypothetical protein
MLLSNQIYLTKKFRKYFQIKEKMKSLKLLMCFQGILLADYKRN